MYISIYICMCIYILYLHVNISYKMCTYVHTYT